MMWKKETARDVIALGSLVFYAIVIVRAFVGGYAPFVYQLVIALLALFLLSAFIKDANQHVARGIILFFFVSLFYKEVLFSVFAGVLAITMIFSLVYLKVKDNSIARGMILGIISTAISYYITLALL